MPSRTAMGRLLLAVEVSESKTGKRTANDEVPGHKPARNKDIVRDNTRSFVTIKLDTFIVKYMVITTLNYEKPSFRRLALGQIALIAGHPFDTEGSELLSSLPTSMSTGQRWSSRKSNRQ